MLYKIFDIDRPTVLAPLAGWTDLPYRRLCKDYGADLVYTEMVSTEGIIRRQQKTMDLAEFHASEQPVGIQIFGADPEVMGQAAKIIAELGPAFIDLNYGCPARKIVKRGAGSAIMRNLTLLDEITRAVTEAVTVPVTAKIRSGWSDINAIEASVILEKAGVYLIAVHPRTQTMMFKGRSDWDLIRQVKEAVSIPVIGNGDVKSAADAKRMYDATGCDGIMIGRAARGNPWIFNQVTKLVHQGENPELATPHERVTGCLKHLQYAKDYYGPKRAVLIMRKHIASYFKGLPGASEIRKQVFHLGQFQDVHDTLTLYLDSLKTLNNSFV